MKRGFRDRRWRIPAAVFILSVGALRCASTAPPAAPGSAAARDAILRADEDFARAVREKGIADAFIAYAAQDAMILPRGSNPVRGEEAIRAFFSASAGSVLIWKPYSAEASRAGDLGSSLGAYETRSTGPDGKPVTRYGNYCTIWRKQPDGAWKYVVSLSNPSPSPQ